MIFLSELLVAQGPGRASNSGVYEKKLHYYQIPTNTMYLTLSLQVFTFLTTSQFGAWPETPFLKNLVYRYTLLLFCCHAGRP
jgi:hypothetical protein